MLTTAVWQLQGKVAQIRAQNNLPDTKSSNPNPNPKPTTEYHAMLNIQLNVVACPTHPDKLIAHYFIGCNCHPETIKGNSLEGDIADLIHKSKIWPTHTVSYGVY